MEWKNCPECMGTRIHKLYMEWPNKYNPENAPCEFCQVNGEPTGRVCVMSDGDVLDVFEAFALRDPAVHNGEQRVMDNMYAISQELYMRDKPKKLDTPG